MNALRTNIILYDGSSQRTGSLGAVGRKFSVLATFHTRVHILGHASDIPSNRTLYGAYYVDPIFNNWETCISFCDARSYAYAGVEYGRVA